MIKVGVRQQNAGDRAVAAGAGAGLEGWKGLDLRAEIGRDVDEEPFLAIGADGDAGLGSRRDGACSGGLAIRAGAIPLGKAASRRAA